MHAFVNDLERPIGTYLYGRRMYEMMVDWENPERIAEQPPSHPRLRGDLAGGREDRLLADAERCRSARTRIEREFDPEAIRRLKAEAERDISVGGPQLAAEAIRAGLVDEYHLFLTPIVVGWRQPGAAE